MLFIGKKLYSKSEWRRPEDMDFVSGLEEIMAEEEEEIIPTTWYGKLNRAVF